MESDPYFFQLIINPILSLIGSVLCITSFIIFKNPVFKESFFYHLKVECAFMSINLLLVVIHPIYYWDYSTSGYPAGYKPFIAYFTYKWPITYCRSICETIVLFSNILSGFRCFLFITTFKFRLGPAICRRHAGISSTLLVALVACSLYSYMLVKYEIKKDNDASNSSNSSYQWTLKEIDSTFLNYFEMFVMTLRDGVGLLLLVLMNLVLLYKIRKRLRKKMRLLRCQILKSMKIQSRVDCEQCESSNNELNIHRQRAMSTIISDRQRIEKAESKLTITIYLSTLKCLLGRLPIFFYFFFKSSNLIKLELQILFPVASFCIYLSYSLSFFLYYYCNNKFRKVSDQYFVALITKLRLNSL